MVIGNFQPNQVESLQRLQQLQQQKNMQDQDFQLGQSIGGLFGTMLGKRNDGKNDSIGNGIRYTNDDQSGSFSNDQIKSLRQFAQNGMDTSQQYNNLANAKFTINNQQYQADRNGVLTQVPQEQGISLGSVQDIGLTDSIPKGAASIGLGLNKKFDENSVIG